MRGNRAARGVSTSTASPGRGSPLPAGTWRWTRRPSSARRAPASRPPQRAAPPVLTLLEPFHGIDGIALSVPSIVGAHGATPIRNTPFSASELEKLAVSAEALTAVLATVGA